MSVGKRLRRAAEKSQRRRVVSLAALAQAHRRSASTRLVKGMVQSNGDRICAYLVTVPEVYYTQGAPLTKSSVELVQSAIAAGAHAGLVLGMRQHEGDESAQSLIEDLRNLGIAPTPAAETEEVDSEEG